MYLPMFFSLLIISSVVLISTVENSFADEIVATGTGFEDSTILELKNNRGNTENIETVRIWLSGENEFKSFKTCLLYTSPSPRDGLLSRMPSSA